MLMVFWKKNKCMLEMKEKKLLWLQSDKCFFETIRLPSLTLVGKHYDIQIMDFSINNNIRGFN